MPTFRRSAAIILGILIVHVFAILSGWYEVNRWFDIPMHFSGGAAMAYLGLAGWNFCIQKVTLQKGLAPYWHTLVYLVGILGFVALIGIAWEWYEYIFDVIAIEMSAGLQPAQMGLGDTMADLFLDLLGALTVFIFFRNRSDT